MAIRSDSYSSIDEIAAYTTHLMDGSADFDANTRPSRAQVEKFIDRASGILNVVLRGSGLSVPVTNSTAVLACDEWVTNQATAYVELAQRGAGFDGSENTRPGSFLKLNEKAADFAAMMIPGFIKLGVTQSEKASDGLQFTGLDVREDRSDPDDTSLRQPVFERGKWEDTTTSEFTSSNEDY